MSQTTQNQTKVPAEIKSFLDRTDELLELLDEIEDTNTSDAAQDFCESVRTKVLSMMEWVKNNNRVTDKMEQSVSNMISGASRWIKS